MHNFTQEDLAEIIDVARGTKDLSKQEIFSSTKESSLALARTKKQRK